MITRYDFDNTTVRLDSTLLTEILILKQINDTKFHQHTPESFMFAKETLEILTNNKKKKQK